MTNKELVKPHAETLLRSIFNINLSKCEVTVCLASLGKDDYVPRFKKLQLSDKLVEEFRSIVRSVLEERRKEYDSNYLVLRTYAPGSKLDSNEVEHVDLSDPDYFLIKDQIGSLPSPVDLGIFDPKDQDFLAGLRFYVIIAQSKDQLNYPPIYCFRSYSPKKELSRSPFFAAVLTHGHFDRVREPLFLFDQSIDCISQAGNMFIFNKDNFQHIFRFFEMVKRTARQNLRQIKSAVPIYNFEDFAKACEGHLQMMVKLNNIANKDYLGTITIADIKRVMKELPQLPVQITESNGKEMLVFDRSDKWALLRLLDDDYLKSLMTDWTYEVTGKRVYQ